MNGMSHVTVDARQRRMPDVFARIVEIARSGDKSLKLYMYTDMGFGMETTKVRPTTVSVAQKGLFYELRVASTLARFADILVREDSSGHYLDTESNVTRPFHRSVFKTSMRDEASGKKVKKTVFYV